MCQIDTDAFLQRQEDLTWYHRLCRIEFGVTLLAVSEVVGRALEGDGLGARLARLASRYVQVSFHNSAEAWERVTGRRSGVWAHLTESILSDDDSPTASWQRFDDLLASPHFTDVRAARRYPEFMSDGAWLWLLNSKKPLPITDSGWLREILDGHEDRVTTALASGKTAFARAARSLRSPHDGWMTLSEWTAFVFEQLSPFDPRRSEWTALEVVRQLVSPIVTDLGVHQTRLDRLHPNNVLVPDRWRSEFASDHERAAVSWEQWRHFAKATPAERITLRPSSTSVMDYRYFTASPVGRKLNEWERRLTGVGRLLLGLLRLNHQAPRIWNIRGNEQVFPLPRTHWIRSLAISSLTLQLIESCLGARRAETRSIARTPELFGWVANKEPNDADFDLPLLVGPNDLLDAITTAQTVLERNQLAVSMNQPRQVIPFRLTDFAASPSAEEGTGTNGE